MLQHWGRMAYAGVQGPGAALETERGKESRMQPRGGLVALDAKARAAF